VRNTLWESSKTWWHASIGMPALSTFVPLTVFWIHTNCTIWETVHPICQRYLEIIQRSRHRRSCQRFTGWNNTYLGCIRCGHALLSVWLLVLAIYTPFVQRRRPVHGASHTIRIPHWTSMLFDTVIEAGVSTIFVGIGEDPQVLAIIRALELFGVNSVKRGRGNCS